MDSIVWLIVLLLLVFGYLAAKPIAVAAKKARVIVEDTHVGLLIHKGAVARALPPGEYSTWFTDDRIDLYDVREQSLTVPGQDVLTSDFMNIRASVILRWRIAEPIDYRKGVTNVYSRIYEDVQVEIRTRTAAVTLDALIQDRGAFMDGFAAAIGEKLKPLGIAVVGADLRDLTLSGPAKQAFADIWKAQKEGQAALERARGEHASLRSLANAARMLKGNPELMNLRLLQALNGAPGKAPPTIVLGGAGGLLPIAPGGPASEATLDGDA